MNFDINISNENVNTLFPFYIKIGSDGTILSCGSSFNKLFPECQGKKILDLFEFVRPALSLNKGFNLADLLFKIIIIKSKKNEDILLRGQFISLLDEEQSLFACSPWITSTDALQKLEISLNDFALHDPIPDMIQILRSKEIVMEDYNVMLNSLKEKRNKIISTSNTLKSLIQSLNSGILLEDHERKVLLTNSTFCSLFGISANPDQLIGANCAEAAEQIKSLFTDEFAFMNNISLLLKKMAPSQGEILKLKDGRIFKRDFIPVYNSDIHIGHMWQYTDVTKETQVSLQISQSEEKFRRVIENLQLGLLEVNNDNLITKVYPGFCAITGYSEEELLGINPIDLLASEKDQKIMLKQNLNRKKGETGVYEVRVRKKCGDFIWMTISGAPIYDLTNKIIGSIGIHWDISERKEKETELKMAKQMAEKSVKIKQQFLANMSHEIRTPMNVIMGVAELMKDYQLNSQQKKDVEVIQNSAEHLLYIINDILDLSKIESGNINLMKKPFCVENMITKLCDQFSVLAKQKNIEFERKLSNIPNKPILGDEYRLNQVLYNLLSNAVKFTDKGKVELIVEFITDPLFSENTIMQLTVKDTGIGIDENDFGAIFNSFSQGSNNLKGEYGGTGLGLTIVSELIRIHQGKIELHSRPAFGSTFIVTIPFQLDQTNQPIKKTSSTISYKNGFKSMNVLLVDDNELNRMVAQRFLQQWGANCDTVFNGSEAIKASSEKKYDLILMDVQMPLIDGYEATTQIRKNKNLNIDTPIIGLTAHADTEEYDRCREAGMNAYMSKPFNPQELYELIEQTTNTNKEQQKKPFDLTYLKEISGGDKIFLSEGIRSFMKETPVIIKELKQALQKNDEKQFSFYAHKIKSGLYMIGAENIHEGIIEIQTKNADNSIKRFYKIEDKIDHLIHELKKELEVL